MSLQIHPRWRCEERRNGANCATPSGFGSSVPSAQARGCPIVLVSIPAKGRIVVSSNRDDEDLLEYARASPHLVGAFRDIGRQVHGVAPRVIRVLCIGRRRPCRQDKRSRADHYDRAPLFAPHMALSVRI